MISAAVGVGHQKLVQEIALRPHNLDTIIPRLFRTGRGGYDISDLLLDALFVQFTRDKG